MKFREGKVPICRDRRRYNCCIRIRFSSSIQYQYTYIIHNKECKAILATREGNICWISSSLPCPRLAPNREWITWECPLAYSPAPVCPEFSLFSLSLSFWRYTSSLIRSGSQLRIAREIENDLVCVRTRRNEVDDAGRQRDNADARRETKLK